MVKKHNKKIVIFDLDETLITSDAKIKIHDAHTNDVIDYLSPSQYNYHINSSNQYLSFDEFDCEEKLGNAKFIKPIFSIFKKHYKNFIETNSSPVSILTARNKQNIVLAFFKNKGFYLRPSLTIAVHDPKYKLSGNIAQRKKDIVKSFIKKGFNDIIMYDDNLENLKAVIELQSNTVKIKIIHVINGKTKNNT